ncbi:Glycosyltransferase involved in cell wall bisynthesis [Aliiroseovarius sediminilitoris]|uniref:Glycosyltransferase involved in cell wall bisynthesis n=1 Tax=Aliiroseovarius sediminilitoris TaxID=1173584 RepID=A0A1I0QS13_9RHOB|nr:glycosyltransferase family 2 protein [Aliiroseovarius sediminilitoris]SEW30331.1 Glycosyltransferase involved in cell wall bisynthesis [Aliiroseovarius sediminilitoris]
MAGSSRDMLLDDSGPVQKGRPLISLIIPVFNEENSIRVFLERTADALVSLRNAFDIEYLFVNDGSRDATERTIMTCREEWPEISLVNLSRNFGKEAALSAGLNHASGDVAIPIDVDLQDPPEVIVQMIAHWQQGAKVVNARRARRDADTWAKRTSAGLFYRLFNTLADHPIPSGVGDFRLLDREVVDAICAMGERSRFNKAIFSWVGFETAEIEYDRPARAEGGSQWSYWKLWKLALDGIFASSTTPLRIWTYVGLSMAVASLLYSAFLFFRTLLFGVDTPGYASTAILILTFGGMNMFALGIIGEYVGRIYTEVRQRPLYIVRSYIQLDTGEGEQDGS